MSKIVLILFVMFFTGAAKALEVASEALGKIHFRSELKVSEPKILTLGDVATFENIDEELSTKIRSVQLGRAPQLGEQYSFTSVFISSLLRKAMVGVPSDLKEKWSIRIPSKLTVSNQGYRISSQVIEERLNKHWQNLCANCRFVMMNLITPQIPERLQNFTWEMRLTDVLPRGQFATAIDIKDENGQSHMFWVKGQVQIQQNVPVTTRAINFGERLAASDFAMQWKDVTFAYDSAPTAENMLGRKVARSLRNAEPIFNGVLEKEKALKRGDVVRVVLADDNWAISMTGVAEQDGFIGDTVKVRNDKTKKQISGIVNADGEVVVR